MERTKITGNTLKLKFRTTDRMKTIVWQLVLMSNECCRLENEENIYVFFNICWSLLANLHFPKYAICEVTEY